MLFRPRCVLRLKLATTFDDVGAAVTVCVLRHDAHRTPTALAPLRHRSTLHLPVELPALAIGIVPMAEIIVVHNSSYVLLADDFKDRPRSVHVEIPATKRLAVCRMKCVREDAPASEAEG